MKRPSIRTALIAAAIVALGAFVLLRIGGAVAQSGCAQPISADGDDSGSWTSGCPSQNTPTEPTNPPSGVRYARYYTFTLAVPADITIDLTSTIDTYLYLMQGSGANGAVLHENDDVVSGNTDSHISESLSAGDYTIEATTYELETTGDFTLTVSGLPDAATPTATPTLAPGETRTATPTFIPTPTITPTATQPSVPADVLNRLTALETRTATQQDLLSTLDSKITALDSRIAALEMDALTPKPTATATPTTIPPSPTQTPTPVATATLEPTGTNTPARFKEGADDPITVEVSAGDVPLALLNLSDSASDADGDDLTFELSDNHPAHIVIVEFADGDLLLLLTYIPYGADVEGGLTETITVSVSDGFAPDPDDTISIAITVIEKEPPPIYSYFVSISVVENTTNCSQEGVASGCSLAGIVEGAVSYNIESGVDIGPDDDRNYAVDFSTGEITVKKAPNYEDGLSPSFLVNAHNADGDLAGLISVRVVVIDVNESPVPSVGTNIGDLAPSFTLPSVRSGHHTLVSFRGDKNVVLVFYRAYWDPFCRAQIVELTDHYTAIEQQDAIVLAVSADNLQGAETAAYEWEAPFSILYNSDKSVITDYGVLAGNNIATPSTFVIDKEGVIRWKYIGSTSDRPSPETILQQLQALEN